MQIDSSDRFINGARFVRFHADIATPSQIRATMESATLHLSPLQATAAALTCVAAGAILASTVSTAKNVREGLAANDVASIGLGDDSQLQLEACRRELAAERQGRTKAEIALRQRVQQAQAGENSGATRSAASIVGYPAIPIGYIESPYVNRRGTPRQPLLAPDARSHLVLAPAISAAALDGLEHFSHVFVLFIFHENTDAHKMDAQTANSKSSSASGAAAAGRGSGTGQNHRPRAGSGEGPGKPVACSKAVDDALRARPYQARVEAPALKGGKTGVFASRSPHRPNAIGMSLCRLVSVHCGGGKWQKDGRRLLVLTGCDLLHNTPVIDIKPYAPFDCPSCIGSLILGPAAAALPPFAGSQQECTTLHDGQQQTMPSPARSSGQSWSPPRDLDSALLSVQQASDLPVSSFQQRVAGWVMGSLTDAATCRVPVVWGRGTVEAVTTAVEADECAFYGPSALRLRGSAPEPVDGDTEATCMLRALTQSLALDIRATHHGRGGGARAAEPAVSASAVPAADGEPTIAIPTGAAGSDGSGGLDRPRTKHGKIIPEKQWYEMFFDSLHVTFTFRDVPAVVGGGDATSCAANGQQDGEDASRSRGSSSLQRQQQRPRVSVYVESVAVAGRK